MDVPILARLPAEGSLLGDLDHKASSRALPEFLLLRSIRRFLIGLRFHFWESRN